MPAIALAFALAAALLHAVWNLLLARAPDVESATAVAVIVAELAFAPVAVVVWRVDAGVWPWLLASGLFELAYFGLLATAYRKAPLSVVYPIARGGAPVLVLLVGVIALGHTSSWPQVGAVVLIVAGILLVRGLRGAHPGGVLLGLAIASCIAGYTLIDKRGITYAGPIPYLELSMLLPAAVYAGAVVRVKGATAVRAAVGPATVLAGLATFGAYALVLKERVTPSRLAGACLVLAGVALLARG